MPLQETVQSLESFRGVSDLVEIVGASDEKALEDHPRVVSDHPWATSSLKSSRSSSLKSVSRRKEKAVENCWEFSVEWIRGSLERHGNLHLAGSEAVSTR